MPSRRRRANMKGLVRLQITTGTELPPPPPPHPPHPHRRLLVDCLTGRDNNYSYLFHQTTDHLHDGLMKPAGCRSSSAAAAAAAAAITYFTFRCLPKFNYLGQTRRHATPLIK